MTNKGADVMFRLFKQGRSLRPNKLQMTDLSVAHLGSEVQDSVHLVQLTEEILTHLQYIDDVMSAHAEDIAKRHYDMIMQLDEVRETFDQYTTFDRYVPSFTKY